LRELPLRGGSWLGLFGVSEEKNEERVQREKI
jgi:hypothetical protein